MGEERKIGSTLSGQETRVTQEDKEKPRRITAKVKVTLNGPEKPIMTRYGEAINPRSYKKSRAREAQDTESVMHGVINRFKSLKGCADVRVDGWSMGSEDIFIELEVNCEGDGIDENSVRESIDELGEKMFREIGPEYFRWVTIEEVKEAANKGIQEENKK